MTRSDEIARNLAAVRERMARACQVAGRPTGDVRLIAVSKTMPADDVAAGLAAGQEDFGENYAQELRDKRIDFEARVANRTLNTAHAPRWHYIGPLQSNKVKYVAGRIALVHTIDTPDLLADLDRRSAAVLPEGERQDCLVQVNVAGEAQKRGIAPERLADLLDQFSSCVRLHCRGLMLIAPYTDDPESARPHFAALRRLRDQAARQPRGRVDLTELSMGMSHDLEIAIAEGATLVRVGTAIFGTRNLRS